MQGERCHQTPGPIGHPASPTSLLPLSRRREGPCGCWVLCVWWFVGAGLKAGDSLPPSMATSHVKLSIPSVGWW